eukprot:Phypoly_transcript_16286.p1 GENE.Phypoly_transcript_16286~~Phypoly_transcript_16286.p1  ORF type:complete len:187 (+),score=30.90 Phypoly_transcript_16286:263-823(+)
MADVYSIPAKTNDGKDATLGQQANGKVTLLVNVASKCGLTPQYTALESLYNKYKDQGFTIAAFPCNDFGAQEPGTDAEIKDFCSTKYNVTFPLYQKIAVKGDAQHPLYHTLTSEFPKSTISNGDAFEKKLASYGLPPRQGSDIIWNFEKFLVDRHGKVVARIDPDITPEDPRLTSAIEAELSKSKL